MSHRKPQNPKDKQEGQTGKVENDRNQQGEQRATQKNEGRRTPQSRHDREAHIGTNQVQSRQGGPNSGVSGKR